MKLHIEEIKNGVKFRIEGSISLPQGIDKRKLLDALSTKLCVVIDDLSQEIIRLGYGPTLFDQKGS